ncbi:MAG: hypothetical protein AAF628_07985 [Planctomycetota bacterium]
MTRFSRTLYPGVFFLAFAVLLLQVALTRVFAIMLWHHLTYMVVSIALLGFGAAGSILTAQRRRDDAPPDAALATWSALFGLGILAAFAALRLVRIDSLALWDDPAQLWGLLALYAITAVPFTLGGIALGIALTRWPGRVHRIYFADLAGSAAGAGASVALLTALGGPGTIVAAAATALLAALCFAVRIAGAARVRTLALATAGAAGCVLLGGAGAAFGLPDWRWHPPFAPGKDLEGTENAGLDRLYSATAEVEVGRSGRTALLLGGDLGYGAARRIEGRLVGQDGSAPTMLIAGAGALGQFDFLTKTQPASALVALGARDGPRDPHVLVIGVGGGIDVLIALVAGARQVTAAEVNPAMVAAIQDRYDDYLGGLFAADATHASRLRLVNAEGRAYVRGNDARYDIIQMTGVDSFTALSSGAYTVSESYLYTTEAVREFYEHLEDDGIIHYSRFLFAHPKQPRETLRLVNVAQTALRELGVPEPHKHIAVFQGVTWASTLIKRGPFTAAETTALEAFAREQGFAGLLYDPLRPPGEPARAAIAYRDQAPFLGLHLDPLLRAAGAVPTETLRERVEDDLARGYRAVLDGDRDGLEASLGELAAAFEPTQQAAVRDLATRLLADLYVASHRVVRGFDKTSAVFHRLLGGDLAEQTAFVAEYPHDISACTDDRPFFFNYYRFSQLAGWFGGGAAGHSLGAYTGELPIGHLVLFASLVQIALLALLMIYLPLRGLSRRGAPTQGAWRYFAYFAALGLGFMFVEIVLMQKAVVFLGHPTYAMSVVLAALLSFAGLGALLAGRWRPGSATARTVVAVAVLLGIAWAGIALDALLPRLLGLSLAARIAAVVLTIAPLGLALGLPFPTGMRAVEARCPQLLPWCWAINGFLSVLGSVLCIVASLEIGFTATLVAAAAVYAVGLLALPVERTPQPS